MSVRISSGELTGEFRPGAFCFRRLLIIKLSGFVSLMACNSETDVFVDS